MPRSLTQTPKQRFKTEAKAKKGIELINLLKANLNNKEDTFYNKVEELVNSGADLAKTDDSVRKTALHYAAGYRFTEITKLLLQKGADPLAQDSVGETPKDCGNYDQEIKRIFTTAARVSEGVDNGSGSEPIKNLSGKKRKKRSVNTNAGVGSGSGSGSGAGAGVSARRTLGVNSESPNLPMPQRKKYRLPLRRSTRTCNQIDPGFYVSI